MKTAVEQRRHPALAASSADPPPRIHSLEQLDDAMVVAGGLLDRQVPPVHWLRLRYAEIAMLDDELVGVEQPGQFSGLGPGGGVPLGFQHHWPGGIEVRQKDSLEHPGATRILVIQRLQEPDLEGASEGSCRLDLLDHGERSAMLRSIVDGAKFGFGSDPLRTLLILSVVIGGSFAVVQVSLPRVIEEDYGRSASAAGLVLGAFGVGMLASSIVVARRRSMRHGVNLATFLGIGLGLGQLLVGLSPNIALATLSMLAWGAVAGVAVASHRTLIQANTPPEMMGRVMGLMMLGFMGALPIGALVSSVLAPQLGPAVTMRVVGVATMAMTIPLTWRKSIVSLR